MNNKPIIFINAKLVFPDRIVPGTVLVEKGIIAEIAETKEISSSFPPAWKNRGDGVSPELIDGERLYLSPGFIDIHNHGRLGCDVMEGTAVSMETIAHNQAEHGVTGFLAGTSSIPWNESLEALRFLAGYCEKGDESGGLGSSADTEPKGVAPKGARCLGIYSEGNFFSQEKRGAHNPAFLKNTLTKDDLDTLLAVAGPALKVVALSPELPGAIEWIQELTQRGIVVAAAHSNADYKEALAGINAGITLATHTFNGMRSLSHQEPGILGAVLDDERVYCELIGDCIHVNPAILSLVYKCKGPDRIILISDSVSFGGLPDGRYDKQGYTVIVKDGVIRLEDGRLAGSSLSLDISIRNMVERCGLDLSHAVCAASLNPARLLGLDHKKGSIAPGKDADLIIFDENVNIKKVFIRGKGLFTP